MNDLLERVRWGRVTGLAAGVGAAAWGLREWAHARQRAAHLAEEERKARWEAEAPERLRRQQEAERQRHEEFLAAAEAKGWRYEVVGQCHLERAKKQFATKLDAQIFAWRQREKYGGSLQRSYRCNGDDTADDGCGRWHLTSKPF